MEKNLKKEPNPAASPAIEILLADLEAHQNDAERLAQTIQVLKGHISKIEGATNDVKASRAHKGMMRRPMPPPEPSNRDRLLKWVLIAAVVFVAYHRTFYNLFVVTWEE